MLTVTVDRFSDDNSALCTYGSVYDVRFSHNMPYVPSRPQWPHVWHSVRHKRTMGAKSALPFALFICCQRLQIFSCVNKLYNIMISYQRSFGGSWLF